MTVTHNYGTEYNKSQTQAQTQNGVLCSFSISDSVMVLFQILRLFLFSELSIKLRNPEIGLYLDQELYSAELSLRFVGNHQLL